jgi:hypothetical protein
MVISIKNLLDDSIRKAGISDQVEASIVCEEFNKIALEILGEQVKGKLKALYVKNQTLTIAVMSSSIGQEIKLHEAAILEKLNQKTGPNKVERLRFLV